MKLQDLVYFKHLAETSSFTKTAEAFFVSQPSISISLRRLEDEFETTLLNRDRSAKSFELTLAGEILYRNTINILDTLELTRKEIHDTEAQSVHLGFLPTIGGYFLPKLLPALADFIGSLKLVEEESSDAMLDLVREKKVSTAIVGSDQPKFHENWLEQTLISERYLSICVSPSHPLANEPLVDISMLKNVSFISLAKGYTHQRIFERWAKENGIDSSSVHYTEEIQTADSLIASGMMVGLMIDLLVRDRQDIVTVPLENAPKFYISLVSNSKAEQTPIQKRFNQTLMQAVKVNLL